jgi:solute carrier family 50 protein (sugar transporter)
MADDGIEDVAVWVQVCGTFAPLASILVGFSPLPTIQKIARERKVGSLPLLPYSTMIVNGMLWFAYGLTQKQPKIWSCNGILLVLGIYYFVNFIKFVPSTSSTLPGTVQQHIQAILATLGFTILAMVYPSTDPGWIIGRAGVVVTVLLFASPLSVIHVVIASQSARSIPLPFTTCILINCFLWTCYGLWELRDPNIYVPNLLGLILALIQLGLKIRFDDHILDELRARPSVARIDSNGDILPLTKTPSASPTLGAE